MILAEMITAYREKKNLSLRACAKKAKIDFSTLHRIEQGKIETCKQWPALLRWLLEEQ